MKILTLVSTLVFAYYFVQLLETFSTKVCNECYLKNVAISHASSGRYTYLYEKKLLCVIITCVGNEITFVPAYLSASGDVVVHDVFLSFILSVINS